MRGRDIGKPDGVEPRERIGLQPLLVDGNRNHLSAGGRKHPARHNVAGILDRNAVAGIQEHAGGKIQSLLRTVDDDDLVRRASEPARPPEIGLQGCPQLRRAAGVVIGEPRLASPKCGVDRPPPGLRREVRRRQIAIAKIGDQPTGMRRHPGRPVAKGRSKARQTNGGCRSRRKPGSRPAGERPGTLMRMQQRHP
ncbi:hypothetical protein D9M70_499150 [compost metagenome]